MGVERGQEKSIVWRDRYNYTGILRWNMKDKYWYMEDRLGFFSAGMLIGVVMGVIITFIASY